MKNLIIIPTSDLTIDQELVYTTFEGVDSPIGIQIIKAAGAREFNSKTLVLSHSSGDLVQAIIDSSLDWTVLNTGISITGANALDWIADIQDVDVDGLPVGAPYRPVAVPPLTKFFGDPDWSIS